MATSPVPRIGSPYTVGRIIHFAFCASSEILRILLVHL